METERPYVIYSAMTGDSGHLLRDDWFWFENLSRVDPRTMLFSSKASVDSVASKTGNLAGDLSRRLIPFGDFPRLRSLYYRFHLFLRVLTCPEIRGANVVVQGFDELAMLAVFLRLAGKGNRVALIPTNNISPERIKRGRTVLGFLISALTNATDVFFYHTRYELALLRDLLGERFEPQKMKKLKYHLLAPAEGTAPSAASRSPRISLFGPRLPSKPIEGFVSLVQADSTRQFEYHLYNYSEADVAEMRCLIGADTPLRVHTGYLSDSDYILAIQKSMYVFLPHNYLYEGKLSGILCDCIANETPVISSRIEPVTEFFEAYGPMGYVVDFHSETGWELRFHQALHGDLRPEFVDAMRRCSADHDPVVITDEFTSAFH